MKASQFESLTAAEEVGFPEYAFPPAEPMALLVRWLADAERRGVREPRALALATADERGRPSSRTVALTEVSERGLVFATHSCSRKAREISATGWASGVLYWRETAQQIKVAGPVRILGGAEADALWSSRPVAMHPMSAASRQSEPLADERALRDEADRLGAAGAPLPRPERYVGCLLEPARIEFWSADPDRLHRRLHFDREDGGGWEITRLQP